MGNVRRTGCLPNRVAYGNSSRAVWLAGRIDRVFFVLYDVSIDTEEVGNMCKGRFVIVVLAVACLMVAVECKNNGGTKDSSNGSARLQAGGDAGIVARVGDEVITLDDFEKQLEMQNPLVRARYKSLDQKKKFLESLVEREAMVQEAKRLGLDQDPEVLHGLNRLLARQYVNKEFNEKRIKQIDISDEQIEQYYQENESRYHVPEKVRVHLIRYQDKKKAENALLTLRPNQKDLQVFMRLARETSEDAATKRIGGDTHYKTHAQLAETYGQAFADAAFSMQEPNTLGKLVEGKDGYYLFRLAGRQSAIDFPLEKVKGQIRTTLFARARADAYKSFIEEVKERVGIKVFEEAVAKAKVNDDAETPFDIPRKEALPKSKTESPSTDDSAKSQPAEEDHGVKEVKEEATEK